MHCFGREDYSDGYDDYAIQISTDNGRTWSKPEIRWKSSVVPEGRMRYAEPAAFFDPENEKLIVLIDHTLYPKDKLNVDTEYGLELNIYDPARRRWTERRELKFPGQRTPAMSFSFPIKTARGRLLFPGMRKRTDIEGKAIHFKNTWAPVANFRFYQDRATGDLVLFLTRYGEQSEKEWMLADYYRYRVQMP